VSIFEVPELSVIPIDLEPREVRGGADLSQLPGRVSLGGPFWAALPEGKAEDDPETAAFRQDPAWRWVLGVLALSLYVSDQEPDRYERVWVDVKLVRQDGGVPDAVAWSMKPDRASQEVSRSTKVTLVPSLKIADVGVDASIERGTAQTMEDVRIEALGEMTASTRWVFRRTGSAELRGCTRLAIVVRAPRDVGVEAHLDVGVVSAHRRAVFFWPRTEHHPPGQVTVLP
jgi:hypothetical protein